MVNPPAYLTEGEAREVIEKEMKKAGVVFSETTHKIANIGIPIVLPPGFYFKSEEAEKKSQKTRKGELLLTGYHPEKRIGYVFVSTDRLDKWYTSSEELKKLGDLEWCSVGDLPFLNTAQTLQKSLASHKGNETLAVFYEPAAHIEQLETETMEAYQKRYAAAVKALSEEDLRKQVRDFLAWLKAQGMM